MILFRVGLAWPGLAGFSLFARPALPSRPEIMPLLKQLLEGKEDAKAAVKKEQLKLSPRLTQALTAGIKAKTFILKISHPASCNRPQTLCFKVLRSM